MKRHGCDFNINTKNLVVVWKMCTFVWWWWLVERSTLWRFCPEVRMQLLHFSSANPRLTFIPYSGLLELWALQLLRSSLRLQLRQHLQGRLRPHLLHLWRGIQLAGLRQVCVSKGHSRRLTAAVHGLQSNTRRLWEVISEGLDFKDNPVVFGHPDVWWWRTGRVVILICSRLTCIEMAWWCVFVCNWFWR